MDQTAEELVITALRAPDGKYYVESVDSEGGNVDSYAGKPGSGLPALDQVIEALAGAGYAVVDRRSGYRNRTLITLRKQGAQDRRSGPGSFIHAGGNRV